MKIHEQLLSKNGSTTIILARCLLSIPIGNKIPTITELSQKYGLVRGTIQNAMKNLTSSKAIDIESRGHLGSYIIKKDNSLLLQYCGIDSLVGSMPLPYSKRYEGLASGLIISIEEATKLPIHMAYMRGSKERIMMLNEGRYDFAIISRFAFEQYIQKYTNDIMIAINFGPKSYLNKHALMLHDFKQKTIQDGMKVGIDKTSIDQLNMTRRLCINKDVVFVDVEYSNILHLIEDGQIDAAVMNVDEADEKNISVNIIEIDDNDISGTEAVLIVNTARQEIGALLKQSLDKDRVLKIQNDVMLGLMTPNY